ncbi:thioredoxin [Anaerotignum faecicola]|nr:thioredoxin [Anaerotignum faecicola]
MSAIKIDKHNFQKEVIESEVPVLLDFWAPWCGPCRMVSPVVDEVALENANFKVGKINVDDEPELAGKFGVMSIPTLVVMKNGNVIDKSVGVQPKEHILKMMEK